MTTQEQQLRQEIIIIGDNSQWNREKADIPKSSVPVPTEGLTAEEAQVLADILNCNVLTCVACTDALNSINKDALLKKLWRISEGGAT